MFLIIRLLTILFLRRSRYLYWSLNSSVAFTSSSTTNGGVSDSFNISRLSTSISISPVGIFLLTLSRIITFPEAEITNSFPNFSTILINSEFPGLIFNWVIPYLSRKSIKNNPPKSLFFATHPFNVTFWPMNLVFSSPQLCVRCLKIIYIFLI